MTRIRSVHEKRKAAGTWPEKVPIEVQGTPIKKILSDTLAKLTALAAKAHEPVQEGTFSHTDRHERDRRAKFGKQDEPEVAMPKTKAKKASAKKVKARP